MLRVCEYGRVVLGQRAGEAPTERVTGNGWVQPDTGNDSRADLARKAFIKLRGELVRLYQKQCELRTSAQSDSETALMDGLLNDLEDISRRAHEKTGFTYTPLSEIAALN